MLPRLQNARSGWQLSAVVLVLSTLVLGSLAGLATATPALSIPGATPAVVEPAPTSTPSHPSNAGLLSYSGIGGGTPSSGLPSAFHLAPLNLPGRHPSVWGK
ncbi:MAG: hypothetical protein WAN40_08175, partial [Thermoplasmata archaeon]